MGQYQRKIFPEAIETVTITPTTEMPYDVFAECYRLSYFMEHMERLPDGRVMWDEALEVMFDGSMAEVHYQALHEGYCSVSFEIPKAWFDRNLT